jgi:thioesterase domain-containing protein
VFCVHPAGGEVAGFRDLAAAAPLNRPVYALQAPPLDHPSAEQSVASLAARYLTAIRTVQPSGPHLLLGWSMGGLVAFDMARRLARAGEPAAHLLLVESYLSGQLPSYDEASADAHFLAQVADPATLPATERPALLRRLHLHRAHLRAAHAYQPTGPRYPGPVTLVQAADQPPRLRHAATAAWERVANLTDHQVLPGDHFTLLRAPLVAELARAIERVMAG